MRYLSTFLRQTFNVINVFLSYEQRSCPSTFVRLWGLPAGPLHQQIPNDDSLPTDYLVLFYAAAK